MRPLISYYGGKQRIAQRILPCINRIAHDVYVEPFAGGAALLFAKAAPHTKSKDRCIEVLNDVNDDIITLYRVCQDRDQRAQLLDRLAWTPYSEADYKRSKAILRDPHASASDRAWSVIVQCQQSFAHGMGKGWAFAPSRNHAATWNAYRDVLDLLVHRLRDVHLSSHDALDCIRRWDSPETLFYCDPPYPGTDMGHYVGYTLDDYRRLCETLDAIQGSYVLSNYMQDIEPRSAQDVIAVDTFMSARKDLRESRTEYLWVCDRHPNPALSQLFLFH